MSQNRDVQGGTERPFRCLDLLQDTGSLNKFLWEWAKKVGPQLVACLKSEEYQSGGKKGGAGEGPLMMDERGMGQTRGQNK